MGKKSSETSAFQVYSIAHSAQCKLGFAANHPERNLRFVLGHAFLLDKVLLRVAEIEGIDDVEPETGKNALTENDEAVAPSSTAEPEGQTGSLAGGQVSFDDDDPTQPRPSIAKAPKTQLPPQPPSAKAIDSMETTKETPAPIDNTDISNEEDAAPELDNNDEDDDGLGLTRFGSASGRPPRMILPEEDDSDEDDDEPVSPPSLPVDFDYQTLMAGQDDEQLGELYESIRDCPCHGQQDVKAKGIWNVKTEQPAGGQGPRRRLAVMQVEA